MTVTVQGPDDRSPRRYELQQPFARLGRKPDNDLVLEDNQISRRHLYLQVIEGGLFAMDLGSRSGIHWDGQTKAFGWVMPSEPMWVGPFQVWTEIADGQSYLLDDFNPLEAGSIEPSFLNLELQNPVGGRLLWRMNRRLALVGTSLDCKVQLMGAGVSKIHCALVCTPAGLWIVDLLGRGGVVVNDKKVSSALLTDGAQVQIGEFLLIVQHDRPADESAATSMVPSRVAPSRVAPSRRRPKFTPTPSVAERTFTYRRPQTLLAALGDIPEKTGLDKVLVPLVNQFNEMQQQMFDQFHQTLMMMFQMFGSMFKDQFDLIRDELARVQELTGELERLQAELSKHSGGAAESAATGAETAHAVDAEVSAVPDHSAASADLGTYVRLNKPRRGATAQARAEKTAVAASDADASADQGEVHTWLVERMAAIQEERQSRWKKILSFLSGSKSGVS